MNKRITILSIIVLVLICSGVIAYKFGISGHTGFDIEIKNDTSENVKGLIITYKGIIKDIELPQIEVGKTYKINVNPKENLGENTMIIYYKDKRGIIQKNTLIGYFEKGYRGKVNVKVNSEDENGLLIMQIQEKVY